MTLEDLGYNTSLEAYQKEQQLDSFQVGRVVSEHKERYVVKTASHEFDAGAAKKHLRPVAAEALARLRSEIDSHDATVNVEVGTLAVVGHRSTIVQIISNLISNAIKFVEADSGPVVHIWAEQSEDNRVRLNLQDNGIGIDQEYHERIFSVFERLHGIESYPGTGIGLAIVARGCERLGGSYGMESTLGEGSRFWVEFPEGHLAE